MYVVIGEISVYETKINGATFCRVIKIIQWGHDTPCIIGGNQK